jgi:hypothetical protein
MLALAFLPTTVCSWVFLQKPPPGPAEPAPPVVCTSSNGAPVIDTIGAVALGLAAVGTTVYGIGSACSDNPEPLGNLLCQSPGNRTLIIVSGLAIAGAATALGFSADHGYSTAAECLQLKEMQLACLGGVEASCRSLEERKP